MSSVLVYSWVGTSTVAMCESVFQWLSHENIEYMAIARFERSLVFRTAAAIKALQFVL